jgi:flagellin
MTNVAATSTSGSGTGATFDIDLTAGDVLTLTVNSSGSGYAIGDTITVAGTSISDSNTAASPADDIVFTVTGVGLGINNATVATQSDATVAIGTMDTALQTIAGEQAKFGSLINRLNFSVANLSKASVMTEQAVGRIMDTDFALETTNLSKQQILNQAATSMLAQANQSKQSILALLQ